MAVQGPLDIAGCITFMEFDLKNGTEYNYLYHADLNLKWTAFVEDLNNQRWSIVIRSLQAFEDALYRIHRFTIQQYAYLFPNYLKAREEIIKIITAYQYQQKPSTADSYPVGDSGPQISTENQCRQIDMKQHLIQMEQDLQNRCRTSMRVSDVATAWRAFCQDIEEQRWDTIATTLLRFEALFRKRTNLTCEKDTYLFPNYRSSRDKLLQMIAEKQNQVRFGENSVNAVPATSNSTDSRSSPIDIHKCINLMESDLKDGAMNNLKDRDISREWQALRQALETQRWDEIPARLSSFEEIFFARRHFRCEGHHAFPNYNTARYTIQQKITEETNLKKQNPNISAETVPATTDVVTKNRPLDIQHCLQYMENDLQNRYKQNFLCTSELTTKWRQFRTELEQQRWTTIQKRIEDFEQTFYELYKLKLKGSSWFPVYAENRKAIILLAEDALSTKTEVPTKQKSPLRSEGANINTNDSVSMKNSTRIEKPPAHYSPDADYLQKCIAWLEKSLKEDVPDTHIPRKTDTDISTQATENAKKLEHVYKDFVRIRERNSELKQHIQSLEREIEQQKRQIQQLQRQDKTIEHVKAEIDRLQNEIKLLQQKLSSAEADKQYWMNRVSKVAGTKLTTNNPGITDLSDPNRPQKLAEKFGELYDNTWTDALELLNDNTAMDEIQSIKKLGLLLKKCFQCCDTLSQKHLNDLRSVLLTFTISEGSSASGDVRIPKSLLDARKETSSGALSAVRKKIANEVKEDFARESTLIPDFMNSCIDICWGMVVQEPKLCFLWLDEGRYSTVNSDHFSLYTRSGTGVEFLVWPAMLLHENGPVLRKGTYQPFADKKF